MTLDEIAKLANVSKTTASYVINGKAKKYRISDKTTNKVLSVVAEHQYSPNHAASTLRAGSSRSFGLVIPDLENHSYARIAKLLEKSAREKGYQLIISCSDDEIATEKEVVNTLVSRKIDLLFVATSLSIEDSFYQKIQSSGTPVIAIDRALNDEYFSSVISEDLEGAFELTTTLLSDDILSIGLIGAVETLGVSKERQQGFLAAIDKFSDTKKLSVQISHGEYFSQQQGFKQIQNWYQENRVPDAILVTSYSLLEGILDFLLTQPDILRKNEPMSDIVTNSEPYGSLKLATFGDNRLLDFLPIKVNSLSQQYDIIAQQALNLGFKAIKGEKMTGIEVIKRKLKCR
ncbi:catabolite repressor/activator [Vibrio sp. SS-MA-C1-2]|uniref:catabolite repressor/activator n=1 Tax=Vibrio sp. SS-MA-C1-2 TaxID=2908646 RepID=UPI001F1C9FED|nr:catabolite repressor/activator [Vibrio sp. SS-MA-C1-2]UJF18139.1 catabolite repressor/activator [Vibrio sp. SS-MA-C1-2]